MRLWIYFIVLLALSFGCRHEHDNKPLEYEAALHHEGENFCSCHGGLEWKLYLHEFSFMRVRCTDQTTMVIMWHQEFKPCGKVIGHENK